MPPVLVIPVANLPAVTLIPAAISLAVSLIQVVHLDLRISLQIFDNFERVFMEYFGARGKLIHEKNQKQKSRDTVPLNVARDGG